MKAKPFINNPKAKTGEKNSNWNCDKLMTTHFMTKIWNYIYDFEKEKNEMDLWVIIRCSIKQQNITCI